MADRLDIFTIEQVIHRTDPAKAYNFIAYIVGAENYPALYIESVGFSPIDIPATAVPIESSVKWYPGRYTSPPVGITFYEDADFTTTRFLKEWRSLIIHYDNTYGYPSEYKRTIEVFLLDDQKYPKLQVRLIGAWPSNAQPYQMGYDQTDRLRVSQTFAVDRIDMI